ncbi:MAG TPA: toll/interleukin-1 receptor domain-containing protein [bacterium]|nr:toll/interleukin-1 receptor domain-containing protein [bacterium]HOG42794.1 toll/interleukin-1 receptor domain-containing protein [bacterium]HPY13692.1 toll/interleukin-1 receptor domain-containing protein [bacterium]HQB08931.1 toll/interleukin-1 receptor domain-containing protein [bacterium]HQM84097.1 toll/interleukin-1 receptor domain-containing protein [bacterium]
MAISQSSLREKAQRYSIKESVVKTAAKIKTAFLCHSHRDEELVKGLIVILKESGINIYVDWQDHSMPATPNKETARKIQEKIKTSDIFLFLATSNSKASRWCPWEIGYADSSGKGIYIIPTSDGDGTYGNEYLQLYPRIDSGQYKIGGKPGYFLSEAGEESGYAISNENLK